MSPIRNQWVFVYYCFMFLLIIDIRNVRPAATSGVRDCYNKTCPDGTHLCKQHRYLSQDKSLLLTDVTCLNSQQEELKKFHDEATNPYGKDVSYEGYAFYIGNVQEGEETTRRRPLTSGDRFRV